MQTIPRAAMGLPDYANWRSRATFARQSINKPVRLRALLCGCATMSMMLSGICVSAICVCVCVLGVHCGACACGGTRQAIKPENAN